MASGRNVISLEGFKYSDGILDIRDYSDLNANYNKIYMEGFISEIIDIPTDGYKAFEINVDCTGNIFPTLISFISANTSSSVVSAHVNDINFFTRTDGTKYAKASVVLRNISGASIIGKEVVVCITSEGYRHK